MGIVTDSLKHFADDIWENRSRVLTGLSCIGTLSTFIFTIRGNDRANERIHMAQAEKGEYLSSWERFVAAFPAYILPGTICAATIGMTLLCEYVNEDEITKLSIALAGLSKVHYDRIRAEKDAEVSEKVNAELLNSTDISDDRPDGCELFHLPGRIYNNGFFWAKPEDIYRADITVNRVYAYDHMVNMETYVRSINSPSLPVEGKDELLGWAKWHIPKSSICAPTYIDIYYTPQKDVKTGREWIEIEFYFEPEADYFGY